MLPLKSGARDAKPSCIVRSSLFRGLALTIFGLTIAGCAGTGAMHAPKVSLGLEQPRLSLTQSVLRDTLQSRRTNPKAGFSQTEQLQAFYELRGFRPAWTEAGDQEQMAAELRARLGRAHEQGLRDEDYRLPPEAKPTPGSEAAEYDIALTEAALRYSRDVRTGRVRPTDIYDDVDFPDSGFDAAAALAGALKNRTLEKYFSDLPPAHPEYRLLAEALMRYRAIADAGGWPALSGTAEIKLEGKDRRLGVLIKRLALEDPSFAAIANPSKAQLREAVKRFQARNGLGEDGRVRGETFAGLNISATARVQQIAANMERWRWLPPQFESRYITINVPDQSVQFVRNGNAVLTSRAVVGRKTSRTPLTRSEILAVVVNPPWNIPGDIAGRDILPHLRRDPNYLAAKHMVVTDGPQGDPYGRTIKWREITPADFPYAIRQLPGPETALGALMLDSPNDFDVYLHDTPNKKLFASNERGISNGCVRVQQIFPLASLALNDGDTDRGMAMLKQATESHKTQRLTLDSPLPVYFLYWTAIANGDGSVGFRPDRYDRDPPLLAALGEKTDGLTTNTTRVSAAARRQLGP